MSHKKNQTSQSVQPDFGGKPSTSGSGTNSKNRSNNATDNKSDNRNSQDYTD